jgi:hypothetical protein
MKKLAITVARVAFSAWVGAACLFIVIILRDVQSPDLSSIEKARIAVERFPVYYQFAFTLLVPGSVLSLIGLKTSHKRRGLFIQTLVCIPLLLVTVDYFAIYLPLQEMTAATDEARPASFLDYHHASKRINAVQIAVTVMAAIALCWPVVAHNKS